MDLGDGKNSRLNPVADARLISIHASRAGQDSIDIAAGRVTASDPPARGIVAAHP